MSLYKKLKPKIAIIGASAPACIYALYLKKKILMLQSLKAQVALVEHGVLIDLVQNIQILSTLLQLTKKNF